MTTHELADLLLKAENIEVGYFDGEGHWEKANYLKRRTVDEADWDPMPHEKQIGKLRPVIEIGAGYDLEV